MDEEQDPGRIAYERFLSQLETLKRLTSGNKNRMSELLAIENAFEVSLDDICIIHEHQDLTTVSQCLDLDVSTLQPIPFPLEWEVNDKEDSDTNSTLVRSDSHPRSPPKIAKMEDDPSFEMSEFFDFDAAAAPNDPSDNQGNPVLAELTSDSVLQSDVPMDIYSPSVSFSEFVKKRESDAILKSFKDEKLAPGRPHMIKPVATSSQGAAPHKLGSNEKDVKNLKNDFLPMMSDPLWDAEFAAFAASGIKSKPRSPPPANKDDGEYVKAGQIYVSYLIRQKIKNSGKLTTVSQEYSDKEIDWATKVLSPDSKRWLKKNCGLDEIEKDLQKMTVQDEQALKQKENSSLHVNNTQTASTSTVEDTDSKMQGLIYPARMRLFSEELNRTLPQTPGQFEPFPDLPLSKSDEDRSTIRLSFTNALTYSTAIEKLQAILTNNPPFGLRDLRVLPELSAPPSQLKGKYVFKVTAPKKVCFVNILQQFFPDMIIQKISGQTFFVEKGV